MIENIKHLHAELYVEVLGDFPDLVVLENREIQIGSARANQDVAASISAKVEALQRGRVNRSRETGWRRVAVGGPIRGIGRSGDGETLRLDVVVGVAGIGERRASWRG